MLPCRCALQVELNRPALAAAAAGAAQVSCWAMHAGPPGLLAWVLRPASRCQSACCTGWIGVNVCQEAGLALAWGDTMAWSVCCLASDEVNKLLLRRPWYTGSRRKRCWHTVKAGREELPPTARRRAAQQVHPSSASMPLLGKAGSQQQRHACGCWRVVVCAAHVSCCQMGPDAARQFCC